MLPVAISFSSITRRAILDQLRYGEQPVKQLAEPFDMSLPAISQHLRVLCETGLVIQRTGRQRIYRLNQSRSNRFLIGSPITSSSGARNALSEYLEENR